MKVPWEVTQEGISLVGGRVCLPGLPPLAKPAVCKILPLAVLLRRGLYHWPLYLSARGKALCGQGTLELKNHLDICRSSGLKSLGNTTAS